MAPARVQPPLSTYRLQLSPEFGFNDAVSKLDYLQELGIETVYVAPIFQARPGSTHGYDVTDPRRISPALGGEDGFIRFSDELKRRGMGLLIDFVPNHMAAHPDNPWWWDVLKYGAASPYSGYFDINWHPASGRLHNRLLIPVLGGPLEEVTAKGEISLRWNRDHFEAAYYEHRFPLHPVTYFELLNRIPHQVKAKHKEITSFVGEFMELEGADFPDRSKCERLEKKFASWLSSSPKTQAIAADIERSSQDPAFLLRLLMHQPYELAFWRRAFTEINYRRFFDVNELVGVRMERPEVFEATHETLLRLTSEGRISGIRLDHVDGMADPRGYLERLAERAGVYLAVEKVLESDEDLPADWPVAGTTGYDFLNHVNGIFISADGLASLDRLYSEFTGLDREYGAFVYSKKKAALETLFGAETRSLSVQLRDALSDDDTPDGKALRRGIIALSAALPVYRTYFRGTWTETDRKHLAEAFEQAASHESGLPAGTLECLRACVDRAEKVPELAAWVRAWQQLTGAATAMGVENSAFFSFNRLLSMNEVGSGPGVLPDSTRRFHRFIHERFEHHPYTMNCTSTHDTKMSGDVRARIHVLSEIPEEWSFRIQLWSEMNESLKTDLDLELMPDRNLEYLLYQAMIGGWPVRRENETEFAQRLRIFAVKAAREAREHTSWIDPSPEYEQAAESFVSRMLDPALSSRFISDVRSFVERISWAGALNSLTQTVLKSTCPGVPDFYQGEGLWNLTLVDPDNRRRVNFERREQRLHALPANDGAGELVSKWKDGRIKLHCIQKCLELRRRLPDLFLDGTYTPLEVQAPDTRRESALSFLRTRADEAVLVAVPRLLTSLHGSAESPRWEDVHVALPPDSNARGRKWRNVFTDEAVDGECADDGTERIAASAIFGTFPVAVLVSDVP